MIVRENWQQIGNIKFIEFINEYSRVEYAIDNFSGIYIFSGNISKNEVLMSIDFESIIKRFRENTNITI